MITEHKPAPPRALDVAGLRSVSEFEFRGGRVGFRSFCRRLFATETPRFLRTDDNSLVVFRNIELRAMAAIAELGNVPSGVLEKRVQLGAQYLGVAGTVGNRRVGAAISEVFSNQFTFNNEPIHKPLRKMMLGQIGPKAIARLEARAHAIATEIVGEVLLGDVVDFVECVALPLTIRFWGEQIGLSRDEQIAIQALLHSMAPVFSLKRDAEHFRQMDDAFAAYAGLIERAVLRNTGSADYPLVQALASELAELKLENEPDCAGIVPRNAGMMLAGVLTDGFHTAAVAAANVIYVLAGQPEARSGIAADPGLVPAAIAEALRIEPPVLMLNRYAIADFVFDGMLIPKGTGVTMMWGAGNLDPEAFPDPERFDLSRGRQGNTTFGGGVQICPGRHAAAMLVRSLLLAIVNLGLEIEPVGDVEEWIDDYIMTQLVAFPVRLRRTEYGHSSSAAA